MIDFLRNTAKELRRLADQAPDIANELYSLADNTEARAESLESEGSGKVC